MVSILTLIICLAITLLAFIGCYRYQAKKFQDHLEKKTAELQKIGEREEFLQRELATLQDQLSHAIEDPVTKLMGLQLFEARLNQCIKESARFQMTMGVLFIDIDNFNVINEALGFDMGDLLLFEIAKRLASSIRQVDGVSRYSRDTFVVMLNQLSKPETAAVVAQRILKTIAEMVPLKDQEVYVTACIGIAIFPTDGQDPATLFRNAERALQQAQEKSKHSYQFYQEKINANSLRELHIINSLHRENVCEEFSVLYQSIFNIENKTVMGVDAVLSWQHPELGLITAKEIYHFAEKQRKLNLISEWLLQHACKEFLHWQGLGLKSEFVGVPIAIKQLENSQFIYHVSKILQELKMQPKQLVFELKGNPSEAVLVNLEKSLNMLQYIGVQLAIDDFGSEGFPLSYMKSMRINYVKLDASLIEDVVTRPQSAELIKSLVSLTKNLSMQLIVKGVQSQQQADILTELGCTFMQGHFLGDPVAEKEVAGQIVH